MSTDENKTRQRRVWEEVFNKGNLAIIPELIAPDYVYRSPLGMEVKGPEGFKQMVTRVRTAFPDIHFTIEDIIAEEDKVVTRFTRWVGGKEVEAWESLDTLAMFQQLGVTPPMGQGIDKSAKLA
jgi:predicted SnoaL-like aldol condensation-catalyzing enzyme